MSKSKLETHKTLVMSTGHIRQDDLTVIEDDLVSYELGEYGWLLYVSKDFVNDNLLIKHGSSNALRSAIKLAQQNDCLYIRFDRDGPYIDELPTFDW